MSAVLNTELYDRLKSLFGQVHISNQGVPLIAESVYDPFRDKFRTVIRQRGEAYCICCPFCHHVKRVRPDTRFRLYVNHRWGTNIPNFNSYTLVKCYNEDCLSDLDVSQLFREWVMGKNVYIPKEALITPTEEPPLSPASLPHNFIPLQSLPPYHRACEYLISRGFDPLEIAEKYAIGYVEHESAMPIIADSLIIPIFFEKQLVAWQARRLVYAGKNKYITSPGAKISRIFYNWDASADYEYAILVEGVFDVWRLGPPALALFGTHLSQNQVELLRSRYKTVFILLDGDAKEKMEILSKRLLGFVEVVPVALPGNCDPADISFHELQNYLTDALMRRS